MATHKTQLPVAFRRIQSLLVTGVLAFVVSFAFAGFAQPHSAEAATTCADADLRPTRSPTATTSQNNAILTRAENAVICLINQERAKASQADRKVRPALAFNSALGLAGRRHSTDMVAKNYFSHTSPTGTQPINRVQAVGYRGTYRNENIKFGPGTLSTPRRTVEKWMASTAGHREAILRPESNEIGVGVAFGVPYTACRQVPNTDATCRGQGATYTADFGSR
jgi:uncharacterized protein YkwD